MNPTIHTKYKFTIVTLEIPLSIIAIKNEILSQVGEHPYAIIFLWIIFLHFVFFFKGREVHFWATYSSFITFFVMSLLLYHSPSKAQKKSIHIIESKKETRPLCNFHIHLFKLFEPCFQYILPIQTYISFKTLTWCEWNKATVHIIWCSCSFFLV